MAALDPFGSRETELSDEARGWIGVGLIAALLAVSVPASIFLVDLIFHAFGAP